MKKKPKPIDTASFIASISTEEEKPQKQKYLRHKVSGKLWAYEPNQANKPHFEVVELYPDEVVE